MKCAVRVVSAAEASARDAVAISSGIPSRALMQRAGATAAAEIVNRYNDLLESGVAVYAGPGNNGGDAWVVARALTAAGVRVHAVAVGSAKTPESRAERELALPTVQQGSVGRERLIVDGLLGIGFEGEPKGEIATAISAINQARAHGATVVALDVPSGLDATTGESTTSVIADTTITFGTLKRGLLCARGRAGRIVVVDIGLGASADDDGAPILVSGDWVHANVPTLPADAHKGLRKRLAIVGGDDGMAGAPILAARAAMRSGIGIVRLMVSPGNVPIVQSAEPHALALPWPAREKKRAKTHETFSEWAHGVLLGPGLGDTPESRAMVEEVLGMWRGPVVLDADALNVFKGDAAALGTLLGGRPALVTPHVNECARLLGCEPTHVVRHRFEICAELASTVRATVLLKGVPTVLANVTGERMVSAKGTPVLSAAGSGDILAGIAATLVTQLGDSFTAGACAAWLHGEAGEIANLNRSARGVPLEAVLHALELVWTRPRREFRYPVLAELPAIAEPA